MTSNNKKSINMSSISKVLLIAMLDALTISTSFFLGLWFRYDFSFTAMREDHLQGYLSATRNRIKEVYDRTHPRA